MGILHSYICPDPTCPNTNKEVGSGHCKDCGKSLKKLSNSEARKILKMKKNIEKSSKYVLFSEDMPDNELRSSIFADMSNLSMHEVETKWMHVGALLSLDSTDQIIASGFKTIIDQNKLIIRQNELLLRELKKQNNNNK